MLLHIPNVLTQEQVAYFRERLASASWADGRITAGYQSGKAKDNEQLPENDPVAIELGALDSQCAEGKRQLFFRRIAARGVSAAVQPLSRWPVVRLPCR